MPSDTDETKVRTRDGAIYDDQYWLEKWSSIAAERSGTFSEIAAGRLECLKKKLGVSPGQKI